MQPEIAKVNVQLLHFLGYLDLELASKCFVDSDLTKDPFFV